MEIKNFIEQWEKMGKAYFWTPPNYASVRRNYERKNNMNIDVTINDKHFIGKINVRCSCKYIYVTRELTENGKKVKINRLKKYMA